MAIYAIVVGDKTDHGGTVITGDPTFDSNGKPMARIGDSVACPLCKRVTKIVTSADPTSSTSQKGMAFDGDKTDCGATLISGGQRFLYLDQAGASESAATAAAVSAASLAPSAAALLADKKPVCLECLLAAAKAGAPLLGR